MGALLFGVASSDPATFATADAVTLLIAFAGSPVPALRAVKVTPMSVVRSE
jgi:ABC-type lipoprotein release transport system permease subunit